VRIEIPQSESERKESEDRETAAPPDFSTPEPKK
jgi:hypothetical protein